MNNADQVVWVSKNPVTFQRRIHLWENGKSIMITDDGSSRCTTDLGDFAFHRDGADGFAKTWLYSAKTWLYSAGKLTQVTDEPFSMGPTAINDWDEMVLSWLVAFPTVNLRLMRRIRTGEADFDGHIDLRDFAAFQNCMTGPGDFDGTEGGFDRLCDCRFLDIDHDRDADADDFALFQAAMDGPL